MYRDHVCFYMRKIVTINAILAGIRNLGLTAYQIVDTGLTLTCGETIEIGGETYMVAWNELSRATTHRRLKTYGDILILIPTSQLTN